MARPHHLRDVRLRCGLIALLFVVASAPPAAADGEIRHIDYVAGDGIIIWCSEDPHRSYTPSMTPTPTEDDPGWVVPWAFSGEPECVGPDAWSSEGHDGGFGGGAFCYADLYDSDGDLVMDCGGNHIGHDFTATVDDALGTPYIEVRVPCGDCEPALTPPSSGCGSVMGGLTDPGMDHWMWPAPAIAWVKVAAVHVDAEDFDTCMGSKGTLTVTY